MKHLLIALVAFALTLGVACKKESFNDAKIESSISKKEAIGANAKDHTSAVLDPTSPGAPGGGGNSYPHNTGACVCGKYATCNPAEYWTVAWDSNGLGYFVPHKTAYGQTTFPAGAIFPGNNVQN